MPAYPHKQQGSNPSAGFPLKTGEGSQPWAAWLDHCATGKRLKHRQHLLVHTNLAGAEPDLKPFLHNLQQQSRKPPNSTPYPVHAPYVYPVGHGTAWHGMAW